MKGKILTLPYFLYIFPLLAFLILPMGAWSDDSNLTFTSWSDVTIANLNADATNWTISDKSGESTTDARWKLAVSTAGSAQVLSANSIAIAELSGLTFSWPAAAAANRIIIDNRTSKQCLTMVSAQEKVHVPVSVGKKVTIVSRTSNTGNNHRMKCSDAGVAVYQQTAAGTDQRSDVFIITSAFSGTSVAFYGETSGKAYTMKSITVTDATAAELAEVENAPTVTSKWNFDQYTGTNTNQIGGTSTGVANFNGLYIHNNGSHAFKDKIGNTEMALYNSAATTTIPTLTGKGANESVALDAFALTVGCAGTVSVTGYASEARTIKIYVNGTEIVSENYAAKDHKSANCAVSQYDVVYIIPQGGAFYFEEISFAPTTAIGVTKIVSISSAGYATFCASQNFTLPSGLKAYIVSEVNSTSARLAEVNDIPACTGVILEGDEGTYTLTSTESPERAITTNYLKANLAAYQLPASGTISSTTYYNYTLAAGPVFQHSSGSGTLAGGKAYLRTTVNVTASGEGGAPAMHLVFDEENTTTDLVESSHPETGGVPEGGGSGLKLFHDGQLLILRDGVTYDVMGRVVK